MSYKLEQLTCEDREKLVQHIKEDTKKLKSQLPPIKIGGL